MDWNKIINEDHSIVQINKDARSETRAKAMQIAVHLHKDKTHMLNYSSKVLREYLRQLVGPEMFHEIEQVFASDSSGVKNKKAIDDLLVKMKMYALFNNMDY